MNLFLFPHQDDEYGVYPELQKLVTKNQAVNIVYLTSGTLDGSPSARRNLESMRVLERIGIPRRHIHFLGTDLELPDGALYQHAEQASEAVFALLASHQKPTRIYTPAWEGGHQDHDAAYAIACDLATRFDCLNASRQFPLYQGYGLIGSMWHTFLPLVDNGRVESRRISWFQRLRCLGYCLNYASQWRTWVGLYPMYALNLLLRGKQLLQPLDPTRLHASPHDGELLYERRGYCSREQFTYHIQGLIDKIPT
jgi:hypothetical protein